MRFRTVLAAAAMLALSAAAVRAQQPIDIKIGIMNDMSGPYADLSGEGSVVAAKMAVEDFHAADKGLNVKILSADHQNKPDIAASIARQWFDQEGVDAIMDLPTSSAALAVSDLGRQKEKMVIVSSGGSSDLTGTKCTPTTIHWTYDTWALAHGTATALTRRGEDSWYFLTADYAFGHALERDTAKAVEAAGGKVLGQIQAPFPTQDFSSYLLQAQSSGAKVIGLANAGADTINAIKQASQFGITQAGQKLAGLLIFVSDVHALGLQAAQGLVLTSAFYWDLNDRTRAFSKRFAERFDGKVPTMGQAGVYSSVLSYLKAVAAIHSTATDKVMAKMKSGPIDDPLFGKVTIRPDGRAVHKMYLFEVKKPSESHGPWDYYTKLSTIPADQAFRPISQGNCPLASQ